MQILKNILAVILMIGFFAGLFIFSIFASLVVLALGVGFLVWSRFQKPRPSAYEPVHTVDVIDGEYKVIEQKTELPEKQ